MSLCRQDGALEGNPVLKIEDFLKRVARCGHEILWHGALPVSIEDFYHDN